MYVVTKGRIALKYKTVVEAVADAENHMFLSRAQWYLLAKDGYPFEYRGWRVEKIESN